jgi:hypothetical protein
MAAPDELTYERASERIGRSMVVIAALGTVLVFAARGWTWAAGFLLGSLISGLNFRWLRRLVESLGGRAAVDAHAQGAPGMSHRRTLFLALRYLLLAGAAYVILRYSPISLTAVITGLFVLIAAVFVEVVFEIVYARK